MFKKILSLTRFVLGWLSSTGLKWESGENPEQSRCCKPCIDSNTTFATVIVMTGRRLIQR